MLSLQIANRFLRKGGSQTVLIVIGISVGLAVVLFIGSLIASLQEFLIDQTLGSSPHVTMIPKEEGAVVEISDAQLSQLEKTDGLTSVLGMRESSAIYSQGRKSSPLVIKSSDPEGMEEIYGLSERLESGQYELGKDQVIVGKEFAEDFGLAAGDNVEITLSSGKPQSVTISGIYDLGSADINRRLLFTNDEFATDRLGFADDEYSAIEIQLSDVFASAEVSARLTKDFPEVNVLDWQVTRADLLQGLSAQGSSTLMIQVFVLIAVGLGIASTLSVSAIQKSRQIGILKAMGLSDLKSALVFIWQGLILGVVGTSLGILIGVGLIAAFQAFASGGAGFPISLQLDFLYLTAAVGIGVSVLSAVWPSRRTSRLDPIEVIQGG